MRSPDCVIIFHSNRSVEVEPLLLIILKTDFLSRNDQSILNIYSLILSKKNKPSPVRIFAQHESRRRKMKQSLSLRRIQSILHRRDNKRDSAQCQFRFQTETFRSSKRISVASGLGAANPRWIPPRSNAKLENSRRVKFENEQNDGPPVSILSRGRNLAGLSARIIPTWDKTEVTSACRKLGVENRPGRSVVPFR